MWRGFNGAGVTVRAPASNSPPKPGAHFQSATASLVGADLVATFREVGLGEGDVTETLSAIATADYACQNKGGQFPNDAKKQSVSGPVSSTQDFPVAKNGHVEGSLSVSAPASTLAVPEWAACRDGQRELRRTSRSWTSPTR